MNWVKSLLTEEKISKEVLLSTSRYIIYSTGSIYITFHFIVSLFFPRIFSPKLWICSIIFLVAFVGTLWILRKYYFFAQIFWLFGIFATILSAFFVFGRSEVLFLFSLLPFMAITTLGVAGTLVVESILFGFVLLLPKFAWFTTLPGGYIFAIIFMCIFAGVFGWGISNNLLSAIEDASFHYYEARKRLEETRQHRAEISRMLKEQSQSNYQLKQMNRMLEQARKRAEEAREDRDRFAMAVSHELRSPLNFIIGFSDLMVNAPETYADPENWPVGLYDDVEEIYNSSKHLLDLINDILDMGKMDARRMPLFRERISPETILDEIKELVSSQITQKGLSFEVECEPNLPYIFVDRTRIRQVLLNVITNSLRFTKQGKISIQSRKRGEEEVEIILQDTGPGIAEQDLEKIFDEFRQVGHENWSREKGSGLGLPISKRFVELHGGRMFVESILGNGTTIRILIPVMEPLQSIHDNRLDLMEGGEQRVASLFAKKQSDIIVCYATDLVKAKKIGQTLFEYEVMTVNNLPDLRQAIQDYYPSALVLDDAVISDLQVNQMIDSIPYQIPVIRFLFSDVTDRSLSLPGGIYRYLVKPVSRDLLIQTLQSLGSQAKNLLVVDDDPTMVRLFTQAIKSYSGLIKSISETNFYPAYSGSQALEILTSQQIDAVLLDLDLPDMHGTQVLAELRKIEKHKNTPVIIISASDIGEEVEINHPGYFQIMYKNPFNPTELNGIFRSVLEVLKPNFREE
jgi:signal transduction histidine kinase/CheY-like chemotaxis protein